MIQHGYLVIKKIPAICKRLCRNCLCSLSSAQKAVAADMSESMCEENESPEEKWSQAY
jgi:hypothetical protein